MTDAELIRIKLENGVPRNVEGCHTGIVDGYVIEGHVPATTLRRLLAERPDVKGLSVPGMPVGSPGMEGPDPQPYNVLTFDAQGQIALYERH